MAFIFLGVLCPIVFISALIGILQHWRILPVFIRVIGTLLSKVNGMGKLESFNAVSSLILASRRTLSPIRRARRLSSRRLFTMAATAMSTVSLSIVGAYMSMLDAKYVVAALILNMFSTFIVLSIINRRVRVAKKRLSWRSSTNHKASSKCSGNIFLPALKWR